MPVTPYHFGPSGFIGLAFRRWIDVPVFLLANVVVDLEVLAIGRLGLGRPYHRYIHTLLVGAAVGVIWGMAAYPLRNLFKKIMEKICIPYKTGFLKMVVSGVLGVWLHVFIDGLYHRGMPIFWPSRARVLPNFITPKQLEGVCLGFWALFFILYVFVLVSYIKQAKSEKAF